MIYSADDNKTLAQTDGRDKIVNKQFLLFNKLIVF
jgi:hypothetical protein